jgi:hypothetical protein
MKKVKRDNKNQQIKENEKIPTPLKMDRFNLYPDI